MPPHAVVDPSAVVVVLGNAGLTYWAVMLTRIHLFHAEHTESVKSTTLSVHLVVFIRRQIRRSTES